MGRQGAVTYSTDRESEVTKMFIMYLAFWKLNRAGKHTTKSRGSNGKSSNHRPRSPRKRYNNISYLACSLILYSFRRIEIRKPR